MCDLFLCVCGWVGVLVFVGVCMYVCTMCVFDLCFCVSVCVVCAVRVYICVCMCVCDVLCVASVCESEDIGAIFKVLRTSQCALTVSSTDSLSYNCFISLFVFI
jgi:hypothetical protein